MFSVVITSSDVFIRDINIWYVIDSYHNMFDINDEKAVCWSIKMQHDLYFWNADF